MIKKTLTLFALSTLLATALEVGESIPANLQEQLNLENNQTYVIDFFASWCKSCKKELPLVNKVFNEKDANIIGVNVDKKQEDGEKFVKELSLNFPIVYDSQKELVEAFDPIGFPALYYVKDGKIINVIFGAVENIDQKIKQDIEAIK